MLKCCQISQCEYFKIIMTKLTQSNSMFTKTSKFGSLNENSNIYHFLFNDERPPIQKSCNDQSHFVSSVALFVLYMTLQQTQFSLVTFCFHCADVFSRPLRQFIIIRPFSVRQSINITRFQGQKIHYLRKRCRYIHI